MLTPQSYGGNAQYTCPEKFRTTSQGAESKTELFWRTIQIDKITLVYVFNFHCDGTSVDGAMGCDDICDVAAWL